MTGRRPVRAIGPEDIASIGPLSLNADGTTDLTVNLTDGTAVVAEGGWETRAAAGEPLVEDVAPGVTVTRYTCHSSVGDFVGERCPRCGVNYYDWLLYDEGVPPPLPRDGA